MSHKDSMGKYKEREQAEWESVYNIQFQTQCNRKKNSKYNQVSLPNLNQIIFESFSSKQSLYKV